MRQDVCALILAAGSASRMGQPKQLLPLGRSLLLETVIRNVLTADFARVIAVIGNEADKIQRAIASDDPRFGWLINHEYAAGQSTSLKTGMLEAGRDQRHVMVFLGDLPFVSASTINQVLQHGRELAEQQTSPFVVQPTFASTAGHPVFFGNLQLEAFAQLQGDTGGKSLLKSMARVPLATDDAGILYDLDTPEEYEQAKTLAEAADHSLALRQAVLAKQR